MKRDTVIRSRGIEVMVGFALFLAGCIVLWDAFDNRGKKMPWPLGGLAPW